MGIYITCFCIWEGGGGPSYFNDIRLYTLHVIYLYMYHYYKKKHYWETKVLHYIPLGPLLFTGSGQFREKTLVGFYTKSSSMSDNSIFDRFGIGLDNPT